MNMKNGLLVYTPLNGRFNIGDYIQSLAAKQFFDEGIDIFIDRDRINSYQSTEPVKVIMNGWYSHNPENWPPSSSISPLFVAFHVNETVKEHFLSDKSISYLKKYEPIGCRDYNTQQILLNKGLKAYFSGCLTLTLGMTYKSTQQDNIIYVVDPIYLFDKKIGSLLKYTTTLLLHYDSVKTIMEKNVGTVFLEKKGFASLLKMAAFYQLYTKFVEPSVLKNATYVNHEYFADDFLDDNEKFKKADEILRLYSRAKYVITSRIHCALPCLGMEVPVVFVYNENDSILSSCRFGGILDFFNSISFNKKGKIKSFASTLLSVNSHFKNKENYKKYKDALISRCCNFISNR